jgi:hypothetical protein
VPAVEYAKREDRNVEVSGRLGLYATMAYSVSRRTREIGVRMAMGASAGNVPRTVLSQGLGQLAIGLVLGLGAAFGLARAMKSLLVRVTPTDPATFVTISGHADRGGDLRVLDVARGQRRKWIRWWRRGGNRQPRRPASSTE